jgi:hypothetical protein
MSFGDDTLDPANQPEPRYFLDNDGDGHWYVVPVTQRGNWQAWVDQLGSDEDGVDTATPAYAQSIGCSPNYMTFKDPRYL